LTSTYSIISYGVSYLIYVVLIYTHFPRNTTRA